DGAESTTTWRGRRTSRLAFDASATGRPSHQFPSRPARTHHDGCEAASRFAAALAARALTNRPKHAEPEPDIRVSRHPASPAMARSTSAICGAIEIAADSRSLRSDASQESRASRLGASPRLPPLLAGAERSGEGALPPLPPLPACGERVGLRGPVHKLELA